ncbi:amidase [Labrys monachus]|uniref:Indoleacetamide hydrolase n=1 Tax=Labrys monachus TaxID=217067 RepID=A0ABU0F9X5_9HYPH|nr:amidase [Labrys monachus]MDQ0391421.1 aspartyl-tRNA(Asn)/glutamyl-tRNA(Gln) amidotransferase subunit A [Labrys monachus]
MDPVAVENGLRRQSVAVSAAEAASVADDLARLRAAMTATVAAWSGLPDAPDLAELLARPAAPPPGHDPDEDGMAARVPVDRGRLMQCQRATNAFIDIFEAADPSAGPPGVLSGLSFAYKDVFVAPGRFPTCGVGDGHAWHGPRSRILATLARQGAVAVGATNLDPHCYAALGLNRDFGRVLNPHGAGFAVGGSSSGSAAAVATGAVAFALGTDTGGSVRIPAALCGVLGLMPTHGVLADAGMAPLAPSHDTAGILAADLPVLKRVYRTLSGRPGAREDDEGRPLRIGIDAAFFAGADETVEAALQEGLRRLSALGAGIVEVELPSVDRLNLLASAVTGFEAAGLHRRGLAMHPRHYPASVRRRLLTALLVERAAYDTALGLRPRLLQAILNGPFAKADLLLCPTLRREAARVDAIGEDDEAAIGALSLEHLRLNRPMNYLGLPALCVPGGHDRNGIPIGLQLVAPPNGEEILFAAAAMLGRA